MSDDFGLVNLVATPFLEIVREERLGDDRPRKQRYIRGRQTPKTEDSTPLDETEGVDDSMSSNHIDLRI
ncbi:MAG: hypothetical protein QUT30_14420 [Acidobacteriota bacterium]|jgi:hypothetical protein|nr:hypothetical protein [Acidobacteriota bacterium]